MKKILLILLLFVTSTAYSQLIPFGYYTNSVSAAMVTLVAPADASTGQSQTPEFSWNEEGLATTYRIQVANVSNFSSDPLQWDTTVVDTSLVITQTLDEGSKWYWRVRFNTASDTSSWSAVYSFTVTEGTPTARAYYIDATSGKDEYNGRATDQAWKTLDKINARQLIPGDTVLLKGGESFSGSIKSHLTHDDAITPIIFNTYGTGKATINVPDTDTNGIRVIYTKHVRVDISNIKIQGLYDPVTQLGGLNTNDTTGNYNGIYIFANTTISPIDSNKISYVNIKHCEISNVRSGIVITSIDYGKTITCNIDSNLVYDCRGGIGMNFNWHSGSRIYGNRVRDIYGTSTYTYGSGITAAMCKDVTIERNLVYNIGMNSSVSGIAINVGAGKNIKIRYNEIYNVASNSLVDAEAIDLENGADSCLVEFNYIHSTPGMGVLVSGNPSFNSVKNNHKTYINQRGSMDSAFADYNVIRFNIMKNLGNSNEPGFMGIKIGAGAYFVVPPSLHIPAKNNQIYNNTIIFPTKRTAYGIVTTNHHDSTKIFNNIIMADSMVLAFTDYVDSTINFYIDNNMYWDREKVSADFQLVSPFTFSTNIASWYAVTGRESTMLNYNPLLINAWDNVGDTLNNPFLIETLADKYTPTDVSLANGRGVILSSYTRDAPTTDAAGNSLAGNMGIGAFVNTNLSRPTYQPLAQRWIGRMDTVQTTAQVMIKDSLIMHMTRDTLLSKMDLFYVFANLDSTSAKLNILKDTFNLVSYNSPTFSTQIGFSGNGINKYFRTEWFPNTSSVNYTLNLASAGIYSMTNIQDDGAFMGFGNSGLRNFRLQPYTSANRFTFALNQDALVNKNNTNSVGLFTISRNDSNSIQAYKNDSLMVDTNLVSSSLSSNQLFILARNPNGSPTAYSSGQASFAFTGTALNYHNQYRLTDNLEWYLNRSGTPKSPLQAILEYPSNNAMAVDTNTALRWKNLVNRNSFHIQIAYESSFTPPLAGEITDLDTNVYNVGGSNPSATGSVTLINNQIHYWRVRAINSTGNGQWSETFNFTTPTTYSAEAIDLFTRFPYAISADRKDLIDSLIVQLKADTVWENLDLLYMYAADDSSNAKINWINSSFTTTTSGSPTFNANQGYTGNASSMYLNTNWIPNTDGVNFDTNTASVFTYVRTAVKENKYVLGTGGAGVSFIRLNPQNTSNQIESRLNENGLGATSIGNSSGFYSMIRSSSANYKVFVNDSLKNTITNASTTMSGFKLYVLARNSVGSPVDYTNRQITMLAVGGGFSDYTQSIISRRFEWYLNRLGAYTFVPSKPILLSPEDAETGVGATPELDWDNVGADIYQIQVSDDSLFATTVVDKDVSGSEFLLSDWTTELLPGVYYWRVRGTNPVDVGTWSDTLSFDTEAGGGGGGGGLTYPTFIDNMYSYWRIKLNEIPTTNLKAFKPF
jgi:hypothetical protein